MIFTVSCVDCGQCVHTYDTNSEDTPMARLYQVTTNHRCGTPTPNVVARVFRAWANTQPGVVRLTAQRRALIDRRLREYSEADLTAAVQGWRHSPFHRGENADRKPWNDLETCLKNARNIELFRDLHRNPPRDDLVAWVDEESVNPGLQS